MLGSQDTWGEPEDTQRSEAYLDAMYAIDGLSVLRCPGSDGEPAIGGPRGELYCEDFEWLAEEFPALFR